MVRALPPVELHRSSIWAVGLLVSPRLIQPWLRLRRTRLRWRGSNPIRHSPWFCVQRFGEFWRKRQRRLAARHRARSSAAIARKRSLAPAPQAAPRSRVQGPLAKSALPRRPAAPAPYPVTEFRLADADVRPGRSPRPHRLRRHDLDPRHATSLVIHDHISPLLPARDFSSRRTPPTSTTMPTPNPNSRSWRRRWARIRRLTTPHFDRARDPESVALDQYLLD